MTEYHNEGRLRSKAQRYISRKEEESNFFNLDDERRIPKIEPHEISFGETLGVGGFCTVLELDSVDLKNNELDACEDTTVIQNRSFIASHVYRNGQARYAVKKLSPGLIRNDSASFLSGVIDLALEAKYLSVIQHPHIIKMRAVSNTHSWSDSYFLVLDRLYDTLTTRLSIWKDEMKKISGIGKVRDLKGGKRDLKLAKRLSVAYDLCSALSFIHSNGLSYRDLKPDNIGFDIRDDVKIFDFGLAKEMHENKRVNGTEVFKMTPKCGSPRYMAPEVFIGKPYNHSVDVYSFGLLLWQICQLKKPYETFDYYMMEDRVARRGERPPLNPKWSPALQDVMEKSWASNISDRPECKEMLETLKEEITALAGVDSDFIHNLDTTNRSSRSIHS